MTTQRRLPSHITFTATGAAALFLLSGTIPSQGISHALARTQQQVPPPPPPPVPPIPPVPPPADPNAPPPTPPTDKVNDIVIVASKDNRLSALVKAIQAAGLAETLSGKTSGPYTVFGPINSAFSRLPNDKYNSLLKPENKAELATLLKSHIVAGRLTKADLLKRKEGDELTTLAGTKLRVGPLVRGTPSISGVPIVATDILADNGVIHIINAVLIPAAETAPPAPPPAENPPLPPPAAP